MIGMDEVFEARMASGDSTILSSASKTTIFSASASTTASMTSWRSASDADVGGELNAGQRRLHLLFAQLARTLGPGKRPGNPIPAGRDDGPVEVDDPDVQPGARRRLGDAGSHETASDDADPLQLHWLSPPLGSLADRVEHPALPHGKHRRTLCRAGHASDGRWTGRPLRVFPPGGARLGRCRGRGERARTTATS